MIGLGGDSGRGRRGLTPKSRNSATSRQHRPEGEADGERNSAAFVPEKKRKLRPGMWGGIGDMLAEPRRMWSTAAHRHPLESDGISLPHIRPGLSHRRYGEPITLCAEPALAMCVVLGKERVQPQNAPAEMRQTTCLAEGTFRAGRLQIRSIT